MAQRVLTLILLAWLGIGLPPAPVFASLFGNTSATAFVPVDRAFSFDFLQRGTTLHLSWQIRPGYYLYRQQIRLEPADARLGAPAMPAGQNHHDEFFGDVQVYRSSLALKVPLLEAAPGATVRVTYQGCAEAGFCYPPETRLVPLSAVSAAVGGGASDPVMAVSGAGGAPAVITPARAQGTDTLPFSPLWALLIGIGIAFTPCVLPMYPLISGIILGAGAARLSSPRVFTLAMVYVQGMAITYTALGMAVAAAGLQFQAALQQPAVLIGLSALFVALALSMFGLFTLQLPVGLQTRLTLWSNRQRGGALPGVFIMGALAGLFCSPCTTAPLGAILLYIAQSGNLAVGGVTLYLYALGMGIPLILVTVSGHRLLPRGGPWMQRVKEGMGFVILALPVFLLERVFGDTWGLRLWSLLAAAFSGWALLCSREGRFRGIHALQIVLLILMAVAVRPLQDWVFPPAAGVSVAVEGNAPVFRRVASSAQINQALNESPDRPAMLDLYADWCVACKEFEKYTFPAEGVKHQLANLTLLQADVTANSPEQQALLKELRVLGLPTILFFDRRGREIPGSRITGFMDADDFQRHLQNIAR
ncbi:protein-disulfide reductase DsbD [Acerihabitans arboris]|uniref:Thiol:disulfide interchange protein DsbD n=1 Tax=Acerihabitans arboris TaxID=2691583 RepID=A0A845SDL6_9GAMM|nr:protein-disulfide reductase DsbD [Acerihabitans arboris]NDL61467.1 protein-disulfide reductase DsbD [Acerihabitans arboris]